MRQNHPIAAKEPSMKRFVAFAVLCCLLSPNLPGQRRRSAGSPGPKQASAEAGQALPGLTRSQIDRFEKGREEFLRVRRVDTGLGPVFNGQLCFSCHNLPAMGGGNSRLETRFGTL